MRLTGDESPSPAANLPSPARWLVIGATAVLQSVASENYACYGPGGVPRYGVAARPADLADPALLTAALTVKDSAQETRLALPSLGLRYLEGTDRQMVWGAYDPARRLQVLWVWDYYRILSHIALRVRLPGGSEIDSRWRETIDAIRAMQIGDVIVVDVKSACGDIHQSHLLASAPIEWTPPEK